MIKRLERRSPREADYPLLVDLLRHGLCSLEQLRRKEALADQAQENGERRGEGEGNPDLEESEEKDPGDDDRPEKNPRRGHGRLGSSAYPGARNVSVPHPQVKAGDRCPCCGRGRLYEKKAKELISVMASAPIEAVRYLLECLRCSACQTTFSAQRPREVLPGKYQPSANAGVVMMKYGLGVPSKRLETWQAYCGVPLPDATQFEMSEKVANCLRRVFEVMEKLGAQSKLFHLDDTAMAILSQIEENKSRREGDRYGMHASGILAYHEHHPIYLYYLGRQHAGENLHALLGKRAPGLDKPLQMGDASQCNAKHGHQTIEAFCQAHAVRKFKDCRQAFLWQCDTILSLFKAIFKNDRQTKGMADEQRLAFHQQHSLILMNQLYVFLTLLIRKRLVEPNSSLGKAIRYMLKRWDGFTRFLQIPGAPLDNNILERALKQLVLLRKNILFFKNDHGARIASILLSTLATTTAAGENPMDYFQAVQIYANDVHEHPHLWLPWNYRERMTQIKAA